ncbi:MAG: prepilin-type N-terminal cleavage/methylation domain-containing protein [Deltaproteobacteria bacterium]|nr:prepilin-type N-terminal cleavage/methylation domain-containing protein [Deltaproteobacteria bacterium]
MVKIFHMLRLINKNQLGMTMMELVIAMLISAVITGAITSTLFQVVEVSASTNNHMIAVRQAQSAGYWVSHDALMAQAEPVIVENAGQLESITMDWGDWDGNTYQVVYTFGDELQRAYSINSVADSTGIIAEFIDPANTGCQFIDGRLILTVTITVGSGSQVQSETRTYGLVPRPGS